MMLQFIQFYVWPLKRLTYGTENITNFMLFNVVALCALYKKNK